MGFLGQLRAWRVILLACCLVWFGPASGLEAEMRVAAAPEPPSPSTEPFGLAAMELSAGGVYDKWLGLQRRIDDDMVQLALCDGDRKGCISPAALRLLAIVDVARQRDGRAKLGEINRAINLAIRSMSDEAQYGETDVWASPLASFIRGAGDCEDYAIAKFAALRLVGIAPDDLRILIMRNPARGEEHAVAAVRLDGRWLMLDNRRMAMIEDADVRNYRPAFVMDREAIRRYAPTTLLSGFVEVGPPAPAALAAKVAATSVD